MRRGDIYTAAARGAYSAKPRPVVVIQDDRFDATASVTVVPFTTSEVEAPLLRIHGTRRRCAGLRVTISANVAVAPIAPLPMYGRTSDSQVISKRAYRQGATRRSSRARLHHVRA